MQEKNLKKIFWILLSVTTLLVCVECLNSDQYDCTQLEGLCLGKVYDVSCVMPGDAKVQAFTIKTHAGQDRVNFDIHNSVGDVDCINDEHFGRVCGVLKQKDPFKMNMNFTASINLDEASITCFGLSIVNRYLSSCKLSLAIPPDPPSNLKVSPCSLVTWDKPQLLRGNADSNLDYYVTVSTPGSLPDEYIVQDLFLSLHDKLIKEIATYNVCVSTSNCAGYSDPICMDVTLGDPKPLLAPVVTSAVINSTAVQVEWDAQEVNSENICYDIETNLKSHVECVTGNEYTINILDGQGVYSIRIRKAVNELKGKWSDPSCIVLTTPPTVSIKNHTISTNNQNTSITTVTIVVQISPLSLGNCQTVPATKLELRSGIHVMVVNLKNNQDQPHLEKITMNFPSSQSIISITVRAVNAIGFSQSIEYNIVQ